MMGSNDRFKLFEKVSLRRYLIEESGKDFDIFPAWCGRQSGVGNFLPFYTPVSTLALDFGSCITFQNVPFTQTYNIGLPLSPEPIRFKRLSRLS